MRILLLGDMSGYHSNLAKGLRDLGFYVDVASSGDSFKKFSRDIEFGPRLTQKQRLDFIKYKINQYDIVQFIKDDVLCIQEILRLLQMHLRRKVVPKLFLSTVGCDYNFWTQGRKKLGLPLFDEIERIDNKGAHNTWKHCIKNKIMRLCVDGEIGCYEYYEAYEHSKKCKDPVFQGVDLSELFFEEMDFTEKLVIYHGLQPGREGFKGSHHIIQAFEILNKKYPQDVTCVAKGGLPYKEYMQLVNNCHVLFDQTNFISHGMNALNGMAIGKIIGCSSQDDKFWEKWRSLLGIDKKPPIVPILPDPNQIVRQVEWILENRDQLPAMAKEGRAYVEKYHDCKKVATMFLDRWGIVTNE